MSIEVSVSGCFRNYETNYGYGRAADEILRGFTNNNINWSVDNPEYDIEIFWGHPPYEFQRSSHYKIGFTAWESTGYKEDFWVDALLEADEVWTPATWLSNHWADTLGVKTFTYPHGVDKMWKPFRHYRSPSNVKPFTFYHIGEPQFRKNGQLVIDAFVELFGNNPEYRLVMKATSINTTRIYSQPSGSIVGVPDGIYSNILFINDMLSDEQLIGLHNQVDCLLYPSIGEGFGLHPLEALASGLPVICTSNWAEYEKFITVPIEGTLGPSPWQDLHPGDTFNVTKKQVQEAMLDMVENYDKYAKEAFKNSFLIHDEYSWDTVNLKAAKRLEEIKNSRV